MLSKIQVFKITAILLLFIIVLPSCVEEPTIPPIDRPFAAVKIVNMTQNVDAMSISIDGKAINTFQDLNGQAVTNQLPKEAFTSYFDVTAGTRTFVVTDGNGVEVFNGGVECNSYEEIVIVFTGEYSALEDENTLTNYQFYRGQTYLDDFHQMPTDPQDTTKVNLDPNQLSLAFANVITGTISDPEASQVTAITATNTQDSSVVDLGVTGMVADQLVGQIFEAGTYNVKIELTDPAGTTQEVEVTQVLTGNTDAIFVIGGDFTQPNVVFVEQTVLPARPK